MSGAICATTGQTTMSTRSRARGRSAVAVNGYVWSIAGIDAAVATITPTPVFGDTKLHTRRPKEASH